MSDSALKLSHIFGEAGAAFRKLSELTRELQFMNDSQSSNKWNDEEIAMLRACIHRFAVDLNKLSLHIKNKTVEQIKRTLRKKAFEDAGIPLPESDSVPDGQQPQSAQEPQQVKEAPRPQPPPPPPPDRDTPGVLPTNPEVTLNMLNATGTEPEGAVGMDLEFDPPSGDEVIT